MSAAYSGTDVTVSKSQDELRSLLRKFGADQFTMGEGATWAGVEFVHADHLIRMRCPLRPFSPAAAKAYVASSHRKTPTLTDWPEIEGRRIWRVLVWSIKARLVAVEEGLETFEQAFLAQIVDPVSNQTVWQQVEEDVTAGALRRGGPGLRELTA